MSDCSDAVQSIASDDRPNWHSESTRRTIVEQESTVGLYGHVISPLPPHGFEVVRAGGMAAKVVWR